MTEPETTLVHVDDDEHTRAVQEQAAAAMLVINTRWAETCQAMSAQAALSPHWRPTGTWPTLALAGITPFQTGKHTWISLPTFDPDWTVVIPV